MSDKLLNERELNFQLYEMLDTEALLQRPRYAEHDRAVFDATLETARGIAAEDLGYPSEPLQESLIAHGCVVILPFSLGWRVPPRRGEVIKYVRRPFGECISDDSAPSCRDRQESATQHTLMRLKIVVASREPHK